MPKFGILELYILIQSLCSATSYIFPGFKFSLFVVHLQNDVAYTPIFISVLINFQTWFVYLTSSPFNTFRELNVNEWSCNLNSGLGCKVFYHRACHNISILAVIWHRNLILLCVEFSQTWEEILCFLTIWLLHLCQNIGTKYFQPNLMNSYFTQKVRAEGKYLPFFLLIMTILGTVIQIYDNLIVIIVFLSGTFLPTIKVCVTY